MKSLSKYILAAALTASALSAQAELFDRGGGMIYDSEQNLTWLQDWNTIGFADWTTANKWANDLVHGGYSDWRLPVTNTTVSSNCGSNFSLGGAPSYWGFGCTGSELGHMFYTNFGGHPTQSVLDQTGDTAQQMANLAMFKNVASYAYWSGTAYAPNPDSVWYFGTSDGAQFLVNKNVPFFAVAVRAGDVSAVPEPQSYAMLLAGLAVLTFLGRRPMR